MSSSFSWTMVPKTCLINTSKKSCPWNDAFYRSVPLLVRILSISTFGQFRLCCWKTVGAVGHCDRLSANELDFCISSSPGYSWNWSQSDVLVQRCSVDNPFSLTLPPSVREAWPVWPCLSGIDTGCLNSLTSPLKNPNLPLKYDNDLSWWVFFTVVLLRHNQIFYTYVQFKFFKYWSV